MKVSNIKITSLAPNLALLSSPTSAQAVKVPPVRLVPSFVEFEISPVSNAISNAIRRTLSSEMMVSRMDANFESMQSTDAHNIQEMIIKRLRMIPIDQSCPMDAIFELAASNDGLQLRDVKSSEIRVVHKGSESKGSESKGSGAAVPLKELPFNGAFTLFTLKPGKSAKITNIHMRAERGYTPGSGMHALAVNVASVAVDLVPEPPSNGDTRSPSLRSSVADPRHWRISFTTNGDMSPKRTVAAACEDIINRVKSINDILYSITNNEDEYVLEVPEETHTIGNLFMRTINDLYPDILAVVYSVSNIVRQCTIRVRCTEDINIVYRTTIKHLVETFTTIKDRFGPD